MTARDNAALARALEYAAEGLPVFPVYEVRTDGECSCPNPACTGNQRGKHPRTGNGHNDATTDPDQFRAWWRQWPAANVAIAVPDELIVIDVDPRNGGEATARALVAEHGDGWTETLEVGTGGGGWHYYLRVPPGTKLPGKLGKGVDVKQAGGYVLAPPSNHASGGAYTCEEWRAPVATAPAWLLALAKNRSTRANQSPPEHASGDPAIVQPLIEALADALAPAWANGGRQGWLLECLGWFVGKGWAPAECEALIEALIDHDPPDDDDKAAKYLDMARRARKLDGPSEAVRDALGEDFEEVDALVSQHPNNPARRAVERAQRRHAAPRASSAPDCDGEDGGGAARDPSVDHVITHLAASRAGVYQRAGQLVRVTRDAIEDRSGMVRPSGAPTIRMLPPARLAEIISQTAGPHLAALGPQVIARGEWDGIRPLDAIVSYPVIRRDGSLLRTSGYDSATRTLAEISIAVDVPDEPTRDDARAAVEALTALVSDFPFGKGAHRSSWLAALLTPLARPAIEGATPMLLLDASARGSGKTLLADVIAVIVTGEGAPRRTAPETAEEWRKVIYALLLAGDSIALIDNVTRMLSSAALDAMLTAWPTYQDRVLGVSEERRVAVRTMVIASANNARLSTDLVRRSILCRLEPECERPESRTGWAIPDLLGHVREHRARYLSAALTILRGYVVAGRPPVQARPMGSYDAWCRGVRDALIWAGAADPAETQDVLRESADVERDELRDLLAAWHQHPLLGERSVTARQLVDVAQGRGRSTGEAIRAQREAADPSGVLLDALRGLMPDGREPDTHRVGNRLRTLRGQIVGRLVLREGQANRHSKLSTWRVLRVHA